MLAEYIWLDGTKGFPQIRGKLRVLKDIQAKALGSYETSDFPEWGFDGGSTNQGTLSDSDSVLKPCRIYTNPLMSEGVIVLCSVYEPDGTSSESNTRIKLETLSSKTRKEEPIFGFEQEYTLFKGNTPAGFTEGVPAPQGPYYCGVGTGKIVHRELAETHLQKCLKAGIDLHGINAEVMPGQWEFQTAANSPLKASDDLWAARYVLERLAEERGLNVSYDPKPMEDWNGAGCHANFSTKDMREGTSDDEGGISGYEFIKHAIERLESRHMKHIKVYGTGIAKRLTGECETSPVHEFSWGVSDRGASIRVPAHVKKEGKGYLEDRRPCANIDPYKVAAIILETVLKFDS